MGQQRRRTGGPVLAAAAATAVLVTTGCTQSGAAADDSHGGDSAVRAAADSLVRAGSSQARTSMEMASGGTRVTIRGAGVYDFEKRLGRFEVVLPRDPAGKDEHRPITELMAAGALYMKNRGAGVPADKWVRLDTAALSDGNLVTGGATDPLVAAELLRGARGVTYVGDTAVGGAKVRHFRGTADIGAAARAASAAGRGPLSAAAKGFSRRGVRFDAYLDERGRLRKVRHQFTLAGSGGGAGGGGAANEREVAVASTTLLYDFGVRVVVRLPARGSIYSGKIAEK